VSSKPDQRIWYGFNSNVIALGLTSFFTDISTEMLIPVMPPVPWSSSRTLNSAPASTLAGDTSSSSSRAAGVPATALAGDETRLKFRPNMTRSSKLTRKSVTGRPFTDASVVGPTSR